MRRHLGGDALRRARRRRGSPRWRRRELTWEMWTWEPVASASDIRGRLILRRPTGAAQAQPRPHPPLVHGAVGRACEILAMIMIVSVERRSVFQRSPHQRVPDRCAVVAERDAPASPARATRSVLPGAAHRDAPIGRIRPCACTWPRAARLNHATGPAPARRLASRRPW